MCLADIVMRAPWTSLKYIATIYFVKCFDMRQGLGVLGLAMNKPTTELDVIEAMGGTLAAAATLGCTQANVKLWIKGGIPSLHDDRIVDAVPGLTYEALADLRKQRRQQQAAE